MTEDDLDPAIFKNFNLIKQLQQNMIYKAFQDGLKDYLRFLLGFAYRNEEIRNSEIVHTIERQRCINLVDEGKNDIPDVPEGAITNDLEKIPRQWGPMINLKFILEEQGRTRLNRKMKIKSEPDYEAISSDMFSVVVEMLNSLKGIKRVESVVFPLLVLKHEFLQKPDWNNDMNLKKIINMIQLLLQECCSKFVRTTLKSCTRYVDEIFHKKTDTIILELKKQSFALANEGEEAAGSQDEDKDGEAAAPAQGAAAEAAAAGQS